MPRSTNHKGTYRIAGCDLGKSAAKFVVGRVSPDGQLSIERTELVEHDGRPMDAFREWYLREDVASCGALGATGLHAEELVAPALAIRLPRSLMNAILLLLRFFPLPHQPLIEQAFEEG